MLTGTVTLNPRTLPTVCDAVYLLDDADLTGDVIAIYEASLDGATWTELTVGELTGLGHQGSVLRVRLTLSLPEESEGEGVVRWFIAYASSTS